MRRFSALIKILENDLNNVAQAFVLYNYLEKSSEQDRLWAIAIFTGRRPKRLIPPPLLRDWAVEASGLPPWLFEECDAITGDMAETNALILPTADVNSCKTLYKIISEILDLINAEIDVSKKHTLKAWEYLGRTERIVFNKLLTGGFRVDLDQNLLTDVLSKLTDKPKEELAYRLASNWHPESTTWHDLFEAKNTVAERSLPYPFYQADKLEEGPENLGLPQKWRAERTWDGIRSQLILRDGRHALWSEAGQMLCKQFPELARTLDHFPNGTVLDGELLVWYPNNQHPENPSKLQARIGRKTVSKKLLCETPVVLHAFDLLEWQGQDLRCQPFEDRRALLETACKDLPLETPVRISPQHVFDTWDAAEKLHMASRDARSTGLVLKKVDGLYGHDQQQDSNWLMWGLDPLRANAVLIYAQPGPDRRTNHMTNFSFAIWKGTDLVPITKATAGLEADEITQINNWIRKNTLQRFGPVRQVAAHHVFEISFDSLHTSTRHKSGLALRSARVTRWLKGTAAQDASTVEDLNEMLRIYG